MEEKKELTTIDQPGNMPVQSDLLSLAIKEGADIEQLEDVIRGTDVVLPEIHLDTTRGVLNVAEGRLPHPPDRHDPAGNPDVGAPGFVGEAAGDVRRMCRDVE